MNIENSNISGKPIEYAMVITNFVVAVSSQITEKNCRAFMDNVEYILPENDNIPVKPDASVNCNITVRTDEAFTVAPRFTLIVTEDGKQATISEKLALYCKIGVKECWVVNWKSKTVDVYVLRFSAELHSVVTDKNKQDLQFISFPEWMITFDDLFDFR